MKLISDDEIKELCSGLDMDSNCDCNYANGLCNGIELVENRMQSYCENISKAVSNIDIMVEGILNPEHMNTIFTWSQIKNAIKEATK